MYTGSLNRVKSINVLRLTNCHVDVKNKPEWGSCGVLTTVVNTCTC